MAFVSNPLTLTLVGITVATSLIAFSRRDIFDRWKFNPYLVKHHRQFWRFFTYALLHADFIHLFINMMVLWSFGDVVEQVYGVIFGPRWILMYLLLYIGGVMLSVMFSFGKHKNHPEYNAVGASGAVSAVVFASILFAPTGKIYLFFIPIGIPAFIFGVLYLVYSWFAGRRGRSNIGHDAHFWGAIYGMAFTLAAWPKTALHFWREISLFFGI